MTTRIFTLPGQLHLPTAIAASRALHALEPGDAYVIDFGELRFVQPFGMLLFAAQLRRFVAAHPTATIEYRHYEAHGYPAHMGFFQACGIEFGKQMGEAPGSAHYIPITRLGIAELEADAAENYEDARETIERRSGQLATVLTREEQGPLHETLTYALREIFRNVLEHSQADAIFYAAQHWPERKLVELAILDEGKGMAASLGRNPHIRIESDQEALRLAILPGISGVAFKGARKKRNDAWANSGYGLFMTSQLCQRGGSFVIGSGDALLKIEQDSYEDHELAFPGTLIRLRFKTDQIEDLSQSLEDLRKRGADIAGTLASEANMSASMSSRMLMLNQQIKD
jgi:hypothetical protein